MAGGIDALSRLQGKVDSNNALVVALDGSSPITGTTITADALVLDRANADVRMSRAAAAAMKFGGASSGVTLRASSANTFEVWSFDNTVEGNFKAGRIDALATAVSVIAPAAGGYFFSTRVAWRAPASAQLNLTNSGETVGVGLDFATDAVCKVRTRAQSAYATVDCLGLSASGVAGASFSGAVTNITVVNGIVTAAS